MSPAFTYQPYQRVYSNTALAAPHIIFQLNFSLFDAIQVPRVCTESFAIRPHSEEAANLENLIPQQLRGTAKNLLELLKDLGQKRRSLLYFQKIQVLWKFHKKRALN